MASRDNNIPEDMANTISPEVKSNIEHHLQGKRLPCPQAFAIADKLDLLPAAVGEAADVLQIRLGHCQLGLFGYPGKQGWKASGVMEHDYPAELKDAIKQAAGDDNHIDCTTVWELAKQYNVSRMHIGYIVDTLGVRIIYCQLGAF